MYIQVPSSWHYTSKTCWHWSLEKKTYFLNKLKLDWGVTWRYWLFNRSKVRVLPNSFISYWPCIVRHYDTFYRVRPLPLRQSPFCNHQNRNCWWALRLWRCVLLNIEHLKMTDPLANRLCNSLHDYHSP